MGWYYLTTVLDDYSRFILSWKLTSTMATGDVKAILDQAITATGVTNVSIMHRTRLLSDNDPAYLLSELKIYLANHPMAH